MKKQYQTVSQRSSCSCTCHESIWANWGYSATHLKSQHQMVMSGQTYAPTALPLRQKPIVPIAQEAGWVPALVWIQPQFLSCPAWSLGTKLCHWKMVFQTKTWTNIPLILPILKKYFILYREIKKLTPWCRNLLQTQTVKKNPCHGKQDHQIWSYTAELMRTIHNIPLK